MTRSSVPQSVHTQITDYLAAQPERKRGDMQVLHEMMLRLMPGCRLWFLDGKDEEGRTVSNPNIGYGLRTITHADGRTREFYQVGLSANTSGISVYIMGLDDRTYLADLGRYARQGDRDGVLHQVQIAARHRPGRARSGNPRGDHAGQRVTTGESLTPATRALARPDTYRYFPKYPPFLPPSYRYFPKCSTVCQTGSAV